MRHWWGVVALAFSVACAAPISPTRDTPSTPTPSPSPTASRTPTTIPSPIPSPTPSPTITSSPTPFGSAVQTPTPGPPQDFSVEPPPRPHPGTAANSEAPRRVPNAVRSFWVMDPATGGRREIDARLRVQTSSVAMWVELGAWHDIRRLEEAAEHFESQISPRVRAAFGSEWTPGIDNDPRIHILHARGLGENVAGYTSSLDEYPSEAYPRSNQAEMMVINVDHADVGSSAYEALLAQQLQRLVQWNQDRNEARWLREGLAELAVTLSGYDATESEWPYLKKSDTPLTQWATQESQHQAAYLFAAYFHQRFGDQGTRILTSEPANGIPGIEATLEKLEADVTFNDLFSDWLATNYLDSNPGVGESHLSYAALELPRPAAAAVHEVYPVDIEATVHQFAADYIVLRGDADLQIQFTGQPGTSPLSVSPYSGQRAWWSSRADESLTTLTRKIDLSGVGNATLNYRIWYDIEPHHDYATVSVRTRDDKEWHILRTPSGTDVNRDDNSPGWSYTGKSEGWRREKVDLSDFAGEEVSVRFSYLTDGSITGEGLLLDDIAVPEIGYSDDLEANLDEWRAEGFLPITSFVPQRYLALLIQHGEKTTVERLPVEREQIAEWIVPLDSRELQEAVLVISGIAPLSSEPAPYQLKISQ